MIKVFQTIDDKLVTIENLAEKGIWINAINPDETELQQISQTTGIHLDLLKAALDEEERSRIEVDESQLLILINVPTFESSKGTLIYDTIPLGIIVTENAVVTVSLKDNLILKDFEVSKTKSFFTYKRTRFVLQILFVTASYYLRYLKQIDKRSSEIENRLHKSMQNEELIKLLNLEKSLVYFITSLRANEIVMEKLLKSHLIKFDPDMQLTSQILKMYPEDEDLLEDVITENKQAIEMAETYSNILSGMMDAFASVISNNLNIVMKFLTSVTIVLALPTMVASFYGMNVPLPFQNARFAFAIPIALSLLLSLLGAYLLRRKDMF
ncbi:MAG TPA: magnesium transporter CorA family protein [Bacillota bacterium]|nr:magnesium transporter CorA family protein [Bacillota bacterium]